LEYFARDLLGTGWEFSLSRSETNTFLSENGRVSPYLLDKLDMAYVVSVFLQQIDVATCTHLGVGS